MSHSFDNENDNKKEKKANKQKVLMLSSRGVGYRYRHLLSDLEVMLPHSKKDAKVKMKNDLYILNELAELSNCNNAVFFEVKKKDDLYLWMSKTPSGPSVKFHLQNLHTIDELKMTGNCLKGSRHVISFDKSFDSAPHWSLLKTLMGHIFTVPKGARHSKPFVDHILLFSILDNRVWFRNYQIVKKTAENTPGYVESEGKNDITLNEIGPRFCLTPVRIYEGSFGGPIVFDNPEFVHPSFVRTAIRETKLQKYKRAMKALK